MTLIQKSKARKVCIGRRPDKTTPIEQLVESVARTYLTGLTKKKSGIVLVEKCKEKFGIEDSISPISPTYNLLVVLQTNMYVGFPKGTMEPFETYEQTAEREFQEETGIDVKEMQARSKLIKIIKANPADRAQMFVYLLNEDADRNQLKIQPITKDEIKTAFWVNIDLLEDMGRETADNKYKRAYLTTCVLRELRIMIAKKLL